MERGIYEGGRGTHKVYEQSLTICYIVTNVLLLATCSFELPHVVDSVLFILTFVPSLDQ